MKKWMMILLCALLCFSAFAGCGSSGEKQEASLAAEDKTITPGEVGVVAVNLEGAGDLDKYGNGTLGGFQFRVLYDPAVIKLGGASLTTDRIGDERNSWSLDFADDEEGSAMVMILDNNLVGIAADTVPLIDLGVQALEGASGETEITFEIVNICDSRGDDEVREQIKDGSVTLTIG